MRKITFAPNEYYHLFNRGVHKHPIFHDQADRIRFLFLILHFQSPLTFNNLSYDLKNFSKTLHQTQTKEHRVSFSKKYTDKIAYIAKNKILGLLAFAFMPNHFHIIVRELTAGGISRYMQRVLDGYTKYFNTKYQQSGHLFQGPFRAVHIESNSQLLYASAYLHCNCRELAGWQKREVNYPWSSYQDYVQENRWPKLLSSRLITKQFRNGQAYKKWVATSGAKEAETNYRTLGVL